MVFYILPERPRGYTKHRMNATDDTLLALKKNLDRPIVLVGLMGTGKSHLGQIMAEKLALNFCDSDSEIERTLGLSVSEIFAAHGEAFFRTQEYETIIRLLSNEPCVIASGGGAAANQDLMDHMRAHAIVVWIDSPVEKIVSRIGQARDRPLLQDKDPHATLEKLLEARRPFYQKAHITLCNDGNHIQDCLPDLIKALNAHL